MYIVQTQITKKKVQLHSYIRKLFAFLNFSHVKKHEFKKINKHKGKVFGEHNIGEAELLASLLFQGECQRHL